MLHAAFAGAMYHSVLSPLRLAPGPTQPSDPSGPLPGSLGMLQICKSAVPRAKGSRAAGSDAEEDVIDVEGVMQLIQDLGIDPTDYAPVSYTHPEPTRPY